MTDTRKTATAIVAWSNVAKRNAKRYAARIWSVASFTSRAILTRDTKLYSKKLGGEAFALDAAQLDTLKKAGYTVPSPEEVIADAAAVKIEPPEGKRAYVVFDFKTGAFKVRTRTQTLAESEVGGFVGEVVSAVLCGFVERADMDNPKADAPATPTTASPLVNMLRDAFLRAASNKAAPAADKPTEAADAPEVVE